MAVYSDSIESEFLKTVYAVRESEGQDARGNYATAATTVTHTWKGDLQPASTSDILRTDRGSDYTPTHMFYGDVPSSIPARNDVMVDGSDRYAIRNVQNWKDHIEVTLELTGV